MRDLLIECGEALYGPRWQSEMARDLGVNKRTIGRWLSGASKVPPGILKDLLKLVEDQSVVLDLLWMKLRTSAKGKP